MQAPLKNGVFILGDNTIGVNLGRLLFGCASHYLSYSRHNVMYNMIKILSGRMVCILRLKFKIRKTIISHYSSYSRHNVI